MKELNFSRTKFKSVEEVDAHIRYALSHNPCH